MLVKEVIRKDRGMQYVVENVLVCSAWGRTLLLNQPLLTDPQQLRHHLDRMESHIRFLQEHADAARELVAVLHDINDITQTLRNLKELHVLDDIEFFELKKFALAAQKIRQILMDAHYPQENLYDLSKIIDTLDPEGSRIAHFYVYSCYQPELEDLRKQMNQTEDETEREKLLWEAEQLEDSVRQRLTEQLQPYTDSLLYNLQHIGALDVLNAKAQMAVEWHLSKPEISETETCYHGLFHPQLVQLMAERGATFQPVDIRLEQQPCLITGANMSGKTVLLKSLAVAQYMFQFGFYVPAAKATVMPVNEVFCVIDDQQTEQHGLSSFAAEMLAVNEILTRSKTDSRILALVDELARTTNPDEGRRIVNAFVTMMQKYNVMAVVTTHYSGVATTCRRLRVKGLMTHRMTDNITPRSLGQYMDYTLVETTSDEVPAEALTIARIFHVDDEFLQLAQQNAQS